MAKTPITVVVTGAGGGGHGEQIVKALRLGARPYHIVTCDITEQSTARVIGDAFGVLPRADAPGYLDAVFELAEAHGARAVFHGSEQEMGVFSRNAEAFRERGIYLPVNPPDVLAVCQDKSRTCEFLEKHGFRVPEFRDVGSLDDLRGFENFPAVLKPSVGGGGSANVFIVQNTAELQAIARYCLEFCERMTLQAYVGTPDQEFTVGVLFGADGELLDSIVIRRRIGNALTVRVRVPNRTGRTELGSSLVISSGISQGEIGPFPIVSRACETIASALSPRAPVNIQCRVVDGQVVPFEINPRFSGTTSLRAMCGYNEPDTLIRRDVFGETVTRADPEGTLILRSVSEHVVPQERK